MKAPAGDNFIDDLPVPDPVALAKIYQEVCRRYYAAGGDRARGVVRQAHAGLSGMGTMAYTNGLIVGLNLARKAISHLAFQPPGGGPSTIPDALCTEAVSRAFAAVAGERGGHELWVSMSALEGTLVACIENYLAAWDATRPDASPEKP